MNTAPDFTIPDWVPNERRKSLNGGSAHRTAARMKFERAGDGVCGVVILSRVTSSRSRGNPDGTPVTVLRVEAGQTNGEALAPDEWVEVYWTSADLLTVYKRHEPREGDVVSVLYGGQVESGTGIPRKSYAIGIEREGEPVETAAPVAAESAETERRW